MKTLHVQGVSATSKEKLLKDVDGWLSRHPEYEVISYDIEYFYKGFWIDDGGLKKLYGLQVKFMAEDNEDWVMWVNPELR